MQEYKQISDSVHNDLARRFPFRFGFDEIPDRIKNPVLFGAHNYDLEQQLSLEDQLMLKGQSVQKVHKDKGVEFQNQCVLSSAFVSKRAENIRADRNFQERLQAGAVRDGRLGIVGNNLDKCIHASLEKKQRAHLFKAQNMIQKIRLDGEKIASDTVCSCGKPLGKIVEIQNNREHNSSSINSIQTCGSVWACPVCRTRIISERAEELKEIFDRWTAQDGQMYMVTLTVPHNRGDNLAELYGSNRNESGISGALAKFRKSRDFSKTFKDRAGYYGDIRGIEVTWGWKNGFHPHIHMLILTENSFDFKEWKMRFHKVWGRACLEAGLQEPSWERGVVISKCNTSDQAQYIAKWSAASEIISQGMKIARAGNFSISELERCLWDKSYRDTRQISMTKAASVLKAYYGAMKGQRQLQTGGIGTDRNWKKELLEIEDEEPEPDKHDHVCYLDYRVYIKIKRNGELPGLLQASERGNSREKRKSNIRFWLQKSGYDPGALKNPYGPDPPPGCFSYQTGFEDQFFKQQKGIA